MRHFLLQKVGPALPIEVLPLGVAQGASPATLITRARALEGFSPTNPAAAIGTVALAVIARAADAHLRSTASAQEKPRRIRHFHRCAARFWTQARG
jgi:hypothetical protein